MDELDSLLMELDLKDRDKSSSTNLLKPKNTDAKSSPTIPKSPANQNKEEPESAADQEDKLVCHACQQTIVGEYLRALKKDWHRHHFVCSMCQKPLSNAFYESELGVICKECASEKYKCCECDKQIEGSHLVYPDGRKVHPNCVPKKKCAKCNEILSLAVSHIEAMDRVWHSDCFTCHSCSKTLGTTFIQFNDKPYCKACVDKLIEEKDPE